MGFVSRIQAVGLQCVDVLTIRFTLTCDSRASIFSEKSVSFALKFSAAQYLKDIDLNDSKSLDVLSPIKLCVVEDNELLLQVVEDSLIQVGYDVQGFENGVAAWQALQAQSFDVVLSDVEMPNMGGIELLDLIRTLDKSVPVILLSGNFTLKAAIENGAQGFVPKPFLRDDLVNEINLVINKTRQAASSVKLVQQ